MSVSYPRVPPHSIEAEQSVIGGILLANSAYLKVAGLVSDADFYRDDHQLIFRALSDMAADNKPIDVVTVSEWMKGRVMDNAYDRRSFLEVIGGLAYLGDLAKDTPSSANIVSYAQIVQHYSLKRQVIHLTTALQDEAFQQGSDAETINHLLNSGAAGFFALEQHQQAASQGLMKCTTKRPKTKALLNSLLLSIAVARQVQFAAPLSAKTSDLPINTPHQKKERYEFINHLAQRTSALSHTALRR
jgi:replicative DNA helicase